MSSACEVTDLMRAGSAGLKPGLSQGGTVNILTRNEVVDKGGFAVGADCSDVEEAEIEGEEGWAWGTRDLGDAGSARLAMIRVATRERYDKSGHQGSYVKSAHQEEP